MNVKISRINLHTVATLIARAGRGTMDYRVHRGILMVRASDYPGVPYFDAGRADATRGGIDATRGYLALLDKLYP